MNELRKDYLLDRWVIIATARSKRPHDFKTAPKEQSNSQTCFFCPGNEHMTPPEIYKVEDNGRWLIRVVANKFPAVTHETPGNSGIKTDNTFYTYASAYGMHEIVIETNDHGKELEDMPKEHIKMILETFIKRISELMKDPGIGYVSVFKNKGKEAGASIVHSHCQIIAYNGVPSTIKRELEASYRHYVINKQCAHCDIIDREKKSYRHVFETQRTVAFTPYASRFPFEIRLFPQRHVSGISQLNEAELLDISESIKKILLKLREIGDVPYNIIFHTIPDNSPHYHFYIEILPRLTVWAGFELETGTIINPTPPEEAARFYRGEM